MPIKNGRNSLRFACLKKISHQQRPVLSHNVLTMLVMIIYYTHHTIEQTFYLPIIRSKCHFRTTLAEMKLILHYVSVFSIPSVQKYTVRRRKSSVFDFLGNASKT